MSFINIKQGDVATEIGP